MHQGKLVFAQLMLYLPLSTFGRCVADHNGEHKVKDFSCLDQFFAMAFAQLGDSRRAWGIFNIINPVNHCKTAEDVARYEVEPYVAAADVYAAPGLVGRGGWTWYTGSAAWM